jgi:ankyrin repeat protein
MNTRFRTRVAVFLVVFLVVCLILWSTIRFPAEECYQAAHRGDIKWLRANVPTVSANLNSRYNVKSDCGGETLLHIACLRADHEVIRFLLESGANPNLPDNQKQTALVRLVTGDGSRENKLLSLEVMLSFPTLDLTCADENGGTALSYAVYLGQPELVSRLIHSGAPIQIRLKNGGWTLLHLACVREENADRIAVVRMLLEAGLDENVKDDQGRMPIDLAKSNRNDSIAELMRRENRQ